MKMLDLIISRRSYRGKYREQKVPKSDLIKIMEAGLAAPSGCNKQTTSLIAVDDPILLEKLRKVIVPSFAEIAPAMICVLSQRINAYRDRCFATQDYSAAIENMLLAIVELGYQSCWYEGHITDEDKIGRKMADILGVPSDYELVCFLPVGIAESVAQAPKKKSFEERAWFNGFKNKTKTRGRMDSSIDDNMIYAMHHISMKCSDIALFEKTVSFYKEMLGFCEKRRWAEGVMLEAGGKNGCSPARIEIFCNGEGILELGAVRHFALATNKVDELAVKIEKAGYDVFIKPKDIVIPSNPEYHARMAFFYGPLGEQVELFDAKDE